MGLVGALYAAMLDHVRCARGRWQWGQDDYLESRQQYICRHCKQRQPWRSVHRNRGSWCHRMNRSLSVKQPQSMAPKQRGQSSSMSAKCEGRHTAQSGSRLMRSCWARQALKRIIHGTMTPSSIILWAMVGQRTRSVPKTTCQSQRWYMGSVWSVH